MTLAALYDVPAPAKLNLFLHVTGRRADGYHLLQSVFMLIDWCDTLHFERRADSRLQRHDLGAALPADDLSLRAARALQQASGTTLGADLSVMKQVPWGAGLGGGSSDAATTLRALNGLWGLPWPRARLQQIALRLGADVPFFVGGHHAFVEGIGERLTPLPAGCLAGQRFVVVKPEEALTTAAIFDSPSLVRDTETAIVMSFLADENLQQKLLQGFGRNDLQRPAELSCTAVTQVAAWLQMRFGNSRMSGSGSAVFARISTEVEVQTGAAVPENAGSAEHAKNALGTLPAGWTGRMCCSLDHHPLVGWAS
jgi:4-diphosphocytidyl-2-C-methyl-D-erythritol kinase